jgi:hypothetical protein
VALNTTLKRAALTFAVSEALRTATTLRAWLEARVASSFSGIATGRAIISTSSNGTSVSWSEGVQPGGGPWVTVETWQELLDLYDTAAVYTGSAVEATILAEMRGLLVRVRDTECDFSGVRAYA